MSISNSPATVVLAARKLIAGLCWQRMFIPLALAFASVALSLTARALSPAPDGGYPGSNTAEGDFALNSLTTGVNNTANGFAALAGNTTGSFNTANGYAALNKK